MLSVVSSSDPNFLRVSHLSHESYVLRPKDSPFHAMGGSCSTHGRDKKCIILFLTKVMKWNYKQKWRLNKYLGSIQILLHS